MRPRRHPFRAALLATLTLGTALGVLVLVRVVQGFLCPPNLTLAGYLGGLGNANDVAVVGTHAFVASDVYGLSEWDVSNPAAPTLTAVANRPFGGQHIAVANNRAIVTGAVNGLAHAWVLDVTSPTAPTIVGELTTTLAIASNTGFLDVAMNSTGSEAVIAAGIGGLWIVDLSTPSAPVVAGKFPTASIQVSLNPSATTAYVAAGLSGILIVNITTPASPSQIGVFNNGSSFTGVAVSGTLVYATNQSGVMLTVDVSVPASPHAVASTLMSGSPSRIVLNGTQLLVKSIGATDGLDVVSITVPTAPVRGATIAVGAGGTLKGFALLSGTAYAADSTGGLKIYNVSIPSPTLFSTTLDSFKATSIAVNNTTHIALVSGEDLTNVTIAVKVLDVTTPTHPILRATLATGIAWPTSVFSPIAIGGTVGALATNGGVKFIDVSTPTAPAIVGTFGSGAASVALNAAGTTAYVASGLAGFQIVNCTTPSAPTPTGSFVPGDSLLSVAVSGNFAYLGSQSSIVYTVDISVPASPHAVASLTPSATPVRVALSGSTAVVGTTGSLTDAVDVLSLAVPSLPVKTATISIGPAGTTKGLNILNGVAFVGVGSPGIREYITQAPTGPIAAATVGQAGGVAPFANVVYVADYPAVVSVFTY